MRLRSLETTAPGFGILLALGLGFALVNVTACSSSPSGAVEDGGALEADGGSPADDGGSPTEDGGPVEPPPLTATPIERLYIEPRDQSGFLVDAISAARSSVEGVFYILTDDLVERRLAQAKARRVRVRVLLDRAQVANNSARRNLLDAGVEVRDSPVRFTNLHQKTLMVDGQRAFVMTLNPSAAAFNDNREYAVLVQQSAALTDLSRLFEADWNNTSEPTLGSDLVVSPQNARVKLTNLLRRATSDILATVEVYSDSGIRTVMKERRDLGARVRVVLADPRDVDQNADAARVLKTYGFEVRFLRTPVLHAKLVLADGRLAYVGSVNLTRTSLDQNREVGAIVDQATIVGQLRAQAEADWTAATPAP